MYLNNQLKKFNTLVLRAAASATDAPILENMFQSGIKTLIISNEKMNDIMKIVQSYEESGLLIKGVCETIKNEAKEQKGFDFGCQFIRNFTNR